MHKAINWVSETLRYGFRNEDYLIRALTHRSASSANNERLEFLGDAVLDSVISEAVFERLPDADEGELSRVRASLVKDTSLSALAVELGIGQHLILGAGEKKAGGHRRASILADALEAIFGAVYLDSSYDRAAEVIGNVFGERLERLPDPDDLRDPKTKLQEYLQSRKLALPEYVVATVKGKAHQQTFSVNCSVPVLSLQTSGSGSSRRNAEQQAATKMMESLKGVED